MKRTALILSIIFFLSFLFCRTARAEEFEIKHADLLSLDKKQITIKGNVVINYKNATILAKEGKVELGTDGQLEKAVFFDEARLTLKDRSLQADKITITIKEKNILAEGNTKSELKDKENNPITIYSDSQELLWEGEGANANGNLKISYMDTQVSSEQATINYKNKKPDQAIFWGTSQAARIEQPTNNTTAKEIILDIKTHDVRASGNVKSVVWPDRNKSKNEQDPVFLNTDDLFINNNEGTITAQGDTNKVRISYQETKGESKEAILLKDKVNGIPEKIIFIGNANVSQVDKQISSEEVVFNFKDKKLTSNTKTNIRPKTIIFKNQ